MPSLRRNVPLNGLRELASSFVQASTLYISDKFFTMVVDKVDPLCGGVTQFMFL